VNDGLCWIVVGRRDGSLASLDESGPVFWTVHSMLWGVGGNPPPSWIEKGRASLLVKVEARSLICFCL